MALTRRSYWGILVIGVVVFLLVDDVWDNPFAIDSAIVWSYLVVFLLVPIALAANHTLSLRNFLLYELELILLKYAITTCIAVALWATTDPPPPEAASVVATPPKVRPTPPPPSKIGATGTLRGVVRDADGAPLSNALVFVDAGLERLTFPVPSRALRRTNDGRGLQPRLGVLRTYQDLSLVVEDGQLHTIAGTNERGEQVFSVPLVAGGRDEPFSTTRALGLVKLSCRVHEEAESPAFLAVLAHPFFTTTDAEGRYALEGVPARWVAVRAFDGEHSVRGATTVKQGEPTTLDLTREHQNFPQPATE